MRLISKLVKGLVMIPIFIFALPALIILALVILILETEEGSLRELIMLEVQAYGLARGFGRFMQKIFIPRTATISRVSSSAVLVFSS